jgi:hypothetical protein
VKLCDICGFEAGTGAALASHHRWRHPQPVDVESDGPVLRAMRVTLGELDRLGRLELIDEAWREALLTLANTLDRNPTSATLWREYRETLTEVLRADEEADDELAAALAAINGAATVGNASTS